MVVYLYPKLKPVHGSVVRDPPRARVLALGLRFLCVVGLEWVAEMGGRVAWCTHPNGYANKDDD